MKKNNNKQLYNRQKRNRNRANKFNTQITSTYPTRQMSFIGKPLARSLDVILPIYAVQSLGTPFYSLNTSTTAPLMSLNITALAITSFPEYAQLVRTYGLVSIKGVSLSISRSSNLISNVATIVNIPSVFIQVSPTNYGLGSVTQQQAMATGDNCIEVNLNNFESYSYRMNLPPMISARSTILNDTYTYGSAVWTPTIINGTQSLPDLFLNLGSLQVPSFTTSIIPQAFLIASVHVRINVVFAAPQSL